MGLLLALGDRVLVLYWAKPEVFLGVWLGWWKGPVITEDLFPLGFSFEKDTRLYFDDTCVVPERLEGKNPAPEEGWGGNQGSRREIRGWAPQQLAFRPSCAGMVLLRAVEHHPAWHHHCAPSPFLPPTPRLPCLQRQSQHLSPL